MTTQIDAILSQRLRLLYDLIEAWLKQPPGRHTDFVLTKKDDAYVISHPALPMLHRVFEVPRANIDAMVKTGYLTIEPRQEPDTWTLSIPHQGFDVFDAQVGDRARPEFERRVVLDVEGDQYELVERTVALQGHIYTLVATRRQDKGDWEARLIRYALTADAQVFRQPILDRRSEIHDQSAILRTMQAIGPTPKTALAKLETKLRSSIEPALASETSHRSTGEDREEGQS